MELLAFQAVYPHCIRAGYPAAPPKVLLSTLNMASASASVFTVLGMRLAT